MEKKILLVDMNAFFASVEQQANPMLRGKPVVVGGPAGTRSVVTAASYESREYGIKTGMPVMEALQRCPEVLFVAGDLRHYIDVSKRIFRICGDYTDLMEIYSIDECFMDVTPTMELFGGAVNIAIEIKRRIKMELGLTCSVGIGPNKVLAKLAAGMQKPNGLVEIKPDQVSELLEDLPVDELHGIGKRISERLRNMGISTAGTLGRTSRDRLVRHFGVYGKLLHAMGNGICDSPVIPYYEQPDIKSVGHAHTLARNTSDWELLSHELLRLSEMVGRRLREHCFAGRTISLVLRYSDMHTFSRQKSIKDYIDDGYEIFLVALSILREQTKDENAIRLIGVSVSSLIKAKRQLNLFDDERARRLLQAMDKINDKYGEFTIRRAVLADLKAKGKMTTKLTAAEKEEEGLGRWARFI